jgi:hypothetical protein
LEGWIQGAKRDLPDHYIEVCNRASRQLHALAQTGRVSDRNLASRVRKVLNFDAESVESAAGEAKPNKSLSWEEARLVGESNFSGRLAVLGTVPGVTDDEYRFVVEAWLSLKREMGRSPYQAEKELREALNWFEGNALQVPVVERLRRVCGME